MLRVLTFFLLHIELHYNILNLWGVLFPVLDCLPVIFEFAPVDVFPSVLSAFKEVFLLLMHQQLINSPWLEMYSWALYDIVCEP